MRSKFKGKYLEIEPIGKQAFFGPPPPLKKHWNNLTLQKCIFLSFNCFVNIIKSNFVNSKPCFY